LLAIGPAVSQARTHHHKRHHHARHHSRHQIRKFGDVPSGSSNTGSPTTSTSPDAGTVASFTNGVLTIKLNSDGSTVSGAVTPDTEIECANAAEMDNDFRMDGGPGPSGSGGNGDQGADNDQGDQADQNDQGDDNDNDDAQNCDPAMALTAGAAVHDAELVLTSAGATWKRVDLG
jgi:hypothetical protein